MICCLPALAYGFPTNWSSLHCPSNSAGVLPTPTYGSDQIVFTVCTELNISAPLIDVYNAILNFQVYPSWNTFVFAVDLPSNVTTTPTDNYVGMPMTFRAAGLLPPFNTTSNEVSTIVFTVCTELNISAPLIDVYNAILNFQVYPSWNTFVFAVDLPSNVTTTPTDNYVGMPMTFRAAGLLPPFNTTSNEVSTVLDYVDAAGYSMSAWRGGTTLYLSFETYYVGMETAVILPLKDNLQMEFDKQGEDLKAYVEAELEAS
ncbi:hypothetical protein B0H11DRAFT_2239320 [Mycena galericulata]|nr:hypothetical protein B0H11DRAFT_2239320 [Mycena galericulata]